MPSTRRSRFCDSCLAPKVLLTTRSMEGHLSQDTLEALLRNALVNEAGCLEWQGYVNVHGYAAGSVPGIVGAVLVHRVVYACVHGDPGGLSIDHLCANRRCINVEHLEAVTLSENIRRGYARRRIA
jgi:hypothetical protein